jgi:hypothetical protein
MEGFWPVDNYRIIAVTFNLWYVHVASRFSPWRTIVWQGRTGIHKPTFHRESPNRGAGRSKPAKIIDFDGICANLLSEDQLGYKKRYFFAIEPSIEGSKTMLQWRSLRLPLNLGLKCRREAKDGNLRKYLTLEPEK